MKDRRRRPVGVHMRTYPGAMSRSHISSMSHYSKEHSAITFGRTLLKQIYKQLFYSHLLRRITGSLHRRHRRHVGKTVGQASLAAAVEGTFAQRGGHGARGRGQCGSEGAT